VKNPKALLNVLASISTNFVINGNTYSRKAIKNVRRIYNELKYNCLNSNEKHEFSITMITIEDNLKEGLKKANKAFKNLQTKIDILEGIKEVLKEL